ncbi:bifunctional diaminohydroxyphosphoribosylaminopyrimidine deaminase/5-amino-6-(5-phosphoribosylamino)uracil reductase RibD [Paraoerskovia sediminicola]
MRRALDLARERPVHGANPRVGCVILGHGSPVDGEVPPTTVAAAPAVFAPNGELVGAVGTVLAEGRNHGAGTPHAEVVALEDAASRGADVRGATAVVTLEPCHHTGRTGPCSVALAEAGVGRVVFAVPDPNPVAVGGAAHLESTGIDVVGDVRRCEGEEVLGAWLRAVRRGRPWVTLKTATTLDGRVAAVDGTSRWITGPESRAHAHGVRAFVDAIAVGTGTVLADDPALTARVGNERSGAPDQPLRVVVGHRDVPEDARVRGPEGALLHLRTHDVHEVLGALHAREVRHLLVEGGPTVAAAFLRAGVVDEVHAYVAPVLLGAGAHATADLGIGTIADAVRLTTTQVRTLGQDVLVVAHPQTATEED